MRVKTDTYQKLTGVDLKYLVTNLSYGDAWGALLKVAFVLETTAKRAVAFKRGADPLSSSVRRIDFNTALTLCRDAKIISDEAFNFADYIRQVRNNLVHKGGVLHLDVHELRGTSFYRKYVNHIEGFVSIDGQSVINGDKEHINYLVFGANAFVADIAKSLFQEDWDPRAPQSEPR